MSDFELSYLSLYIFFGCMIVLVYAPYLYAFAYTFNTCRTRLGKALLSFLAVIGGFGLITAIPLVSLIFIGLFTYLEAIVKYIHGLL